MMKKFLIASSAASVLISVASALTGNTKLIGLNMSVGSVNYLVFNIVMFHPKNESK